MEKVAARGLRQCLRLRTAGNCRVGMTPFSLPVRARHISLSICAVRHSSNLPSSRIQISIASSLQAQRKYSTQESSIRGTIGKGEAGTRDKYEAQRDEQVLQAPEHLNEKEKAIWEMLMRELECDSLEVQDISGGCGSMYGIDIVSERFRGLNMLKQQRLVNQVLGEEIKGWHGVQLKTRAP